jgi:dCMP deaminase
MTLDLTEYGKAIFDVKRGFLTIGLTGYTGSGCTTIRKRLETSNRLSFPDFGSLSDNDEDYRGKRIHEKLKRTWTGLSWEPFTSIEISAIIFAFACHSLRKHRYTDDISRSINALIDDGSDNLKHLGKLLNIKVDVKDKDYTHIINAYCAAKRYYESFKGFYSDRPAELTKIMQDFGDQIRKYGHIKPKRNEPSKAQNLFTLPEVIRRVIRAYRKKDKKKHFVIDAFRNPYEIEYFKRRYEEFYVVAVLRDDKERRHALEKNLGFSENEIEEVYVKEKNELEEEGARDEDIRDWVVSQDIDACFAKADVFVNNKLSQEPEHYPNLDYALIKLITLAKYPGSIPPTRDERSMQIAVTAREMSGCISRQVGAVVVNSDGYVVGIGWNDPPQGQVPCSLRTGKELVDNAEKSNSSNVADNGSEKQRISEVFSEYERSPKFVEYIINNNKNVDGPYCFRTEVAKLEGEAKKDKMREFQRALHAEENALFQATGFTHRKLADAQLYTTSCTCNLCAKKAYQLGVNKIIYIEDYSSIAVSQTLNTGSRPIEVVKFEGIVGSAYFRLFSSLVSEKDLVKWYH